LNENLNLNETILYSFASTMVGQSEELIQDKNKNVMKAIIGMLKKIFITTSKYSLVYNRIELSTHVKAYEPAPAGRLR